MKDALPLMQGILKIVIMILTQKNEQICTVADTSKPTKSVEV